MPRIDQAGRDVTGLPGLWDEDDRIVPGDIDVWSHVFKMLIPVSGAIVPSVIDRVKSGRANRTDQTIYDLLMSGF